MCATIALRLTDLLTTELVKIPLEARDKAAVLRELVDVLDSGVELEDADAVLRGIEEREAVLSTGIGNGVAIPHCKSGAVSELRIVAGRTAEPVPFDALDGKPVSLIFLLVGPETKSGAHVRALSRIARLARRPELREQLTAAPGAEEFYAALRDAEMP